MISSEYLVIWDTSTSINLSTEIAMQEFILQKSVRNDEGRSTVVGSGAEGGVWGDSLSCRRLDMKLAGQKLMHFQNRAIKMA